MSEAVAIDAVYPSSLIPPSGEVTLMFTDIEGSTRGWDTYLEAFRAALKEHHRLVRGAIQAHRGFEVKTVGDSFMVAFGDPVEAAACALDVQRAIEGGSFEQVGGLRVRIGLHCGPIEPYGGDYYGPVVNHAARIESAGHGGQIVLSEDIAALIADALPAGAAISDDGLHRLRDLGAPLRLFLLTANDLPQREYPPLRTLDPRAHNFPAQVTSFIGRERETEELLALLRDKKRLISLTGPGGTGKTRLSMQVAAEAVQDYPDGIWLVELASVADEREVPSAIALALKIPLVPEKNVPDQVFEHLRDKRCLLVLDNFEHVIDAATFVNKLLKQCPSVVCFITSQHLLQIAGEIEYALEPLSLPPEDVTLETAFQYPSVQLFVERAQAARAQFTLTEESLPAVAEICCRLDGSPLALELTAALVRGMMPIQILPRLKDRFRLLASSRRDLDPRHRSLRGALDWSWELLNDEERGLFSEVSVFAGGFCMEDLEAISDAPDALLLAFALRDKSLLKTEDTSDDTRYFMLETIRIYATEKLAECGLADTLRERHARRYLEIAQKLSGELNSSGDAIRRMTTEIDNLRAGMDWAIECEDTAVIGAYGRPLARFFIWRGLHEEGDRRLAAAEEVCRRRNDQEALAGLLLQHGNIAQNTSDNPAAQAFWTECHSIYQQLGDRKRMVAPLVNLGNVAWAVSDYEAARQRWEEALDLDRQATQPQYEAFLLSNLGIIARDQGRFEEANDYLRQSLDMHRKDGNQTGIAYALWHQAELLRNQRRYAEALEKMEQSRVLFERVGYQYGLALTMVETAVTLLEAGQPEAAEDWARDGLTSARRLGDRRCEMYALDVLGRLATLRRDLPEARRLLSGSARLAADLREQKHMAVVLRHYGDLLVQEGQRDEALVFLCAAHRDYVARGLYDGILLGEQISSLESQNGSSSMTCACDQIPDTKSLCVQIIEING